MENRKGSMTALVSAFGRAYHALYEEPKIFNDYLARKLIKDEEFCNISKNMAEGIKFFNSKEAYLYPDKESALKWVVQNQIAPTPLGRNRYAEDMLENAIKLGVKQYVILGAGFDTFAFRKPKVLNKIKVFEVDHPDTQELKLKRIKALGWEIDANIKYVPVDFSKDYFKNSLLDSEYNPNELTFFSWLGVTYYLRREEIYNMFKDIASISPQGSALVFDYADGDIFYPEKTSARVSAMVGMATMAGEPMKTGYAYFELESNLEKAGLLIYEHLSPVDIEERYFKGRADYYHAFENINYTLAVVGNKELDF
ncbi:class I SAM-dependent methyltransferase [Marinisporobacter balticus]|uniref:S-adenosyl-L-methionine-dependent methyltransferase n=1 Tax=Marinisporobacter balticus TaxID=2018667 RepID=A0A4R2KU54_9FIRM|nr:class I SAM-dependent methyltransferase [Marinisporobacter balticus]TCO74639.1 methyltransferase (TIGR00027 family) [Marinisporobacter balticus]